MVIHIVYLQWDYSGILASTGKKSKDTAEELVEPWANRRSAILSKYTTSEKLSIVTSFLSGGEKGAYFLKEIDEMESFTKLNIK